MNREKPVRWWPGILVAGLYGAVLLYVWFGEAESRQHQVMATIGFGLIAGALLFLWILLFSRIPWRRRLLLVAALVLLFGGVGANLQVVGFTGDVIPVLAWRWESPDRVLADPVDKINAGDGIIADEPGPGDFQQFLGPTRNGIVDGVALASDWGTHPPQIVWKQAIGAGWSGFAVSGWRALTQEQRGELEMVTCYRLDTGELIWSHQDATRFEDVLSGDGPRATPSIDEGRVYSIGATGLLNCLDLASGRRLWSRDVLAENGAALPIYGVAASPLVKDDRVIVLAGGPGGRSLVAYNKISGELVWSGGSDPAAYASPLVADLAGRQQVVVFNQATVCGHDLESGEVLWSHVWTGLNEITAQPVPLSPDTLFVSSGYGAGGRLLRIADEPDGYRAELVWATPRLKAKLSNVVFHQGFLYGLDDGVLVCLDPVDGQRKWKRGRYGHGQLLLAGDLLLITSEKGEVVLLEANPEAHRELGRFQAIQGKTWNHAALAGPYLLVRNATEAACLRLPTASSRTL